VQGQLISRFPDFVGWSLERHTRHGRGRLVVECPPGAQPLAAVAVALDIDGRPAGAPEEVRLFDGRAIWDGGDDPCRLALFYANPNTFDYFSPAACRELIAAVHGKFDARLGHLFGSVIVGSFQDELAAMPTWSSEFAARFRERYGYELVPRLAGLFADLGADDASLRDDYHRLRAALAEEAFFRPLHDWHEQRGLLCGFDQQTGAREGRPLASTEIYGDYLRTHRWFSAPGSDHHGDAKIHSSLAHHYGRPRVWIECFHSAGWGATLEDTFDWLLPWLGAGANLYDPHATYYATRSGWWEWAPPTWDWRQPYWPHHSHFARAVARLCSMLTSGEHVCELGVLYPSATARAGLASDGAPASVAERAQAVYLEVVGQMAWWHPTPGVLNRLARDFDVLDDDTVANADVYEAALVTGNERFRVVVLPACSVLEAATARQLLRFVDSGGLLVAVGAMPETLVGADSTGALAALTERFASGVARVVPHAADLGIVLAEVPPVVEAPVPTLVRREAGVTIVFVPATAPRATVLGLPEGINAQDTDMVDRAWRGKLDYRLERNRYAEEVEVFVRGVEGAPELWEPFSGVRRRLEARQVEGGVQLRVPFHDGPAAVVVFGAQGSTTLEEPLRRSVPTCERQLDGAWEVSVGTPAPDRWKDLGTPSSGSETWLVDHRMDGGPWQPIQATFGPRALWIGPANDTSLPAPGEAGDVWKEAIWSTSRGIWKDTEHIENLGPKGRVPEEFLDFGPVPRGESVHLRTQVRSDKPLATHLAIGAAAGKRAWLDGVEIPLEGDGYLAFGRVVLGPDEAILEIRFTAREDLGALRGHFAFVEDRAGYERPEWLEVRSGDRDAVVLISTTIELAAQPTSAKVLVGSFGPCRVLVDGREVARQGGFGPRYEDGQERLHWQDLAESLTPGEHELGLEVPVRVGVSAAVLLDGEVVSAEGTIPLRSGPGWRATCEGKPLELGYRLVQVRGDPAYVHARHRPHPLPEAGWLEPGRPSADAGGSVTLVPPGLPARQQLRFTVPPGAFSMRVPLVEGCQVHAVLDEAEIVLTGDYSASLPPCQGPASCTVTILPPDGLVGGALLTGPVHFELGPGSMELVDWQEAGLVSFSGAVRYRRWLEPLARAASHVALDLGDVRGTAEVFVDGTSVGVRVVAPYRFDLTRHLGAKGSLLEILVLGTLAPHLEATSPTSYVQKGQTRSGLFGPVQLLAWDAVLSGGAVA
jgi:hypothetical protein